MSAVSLVTAHHEGDGVPRDDLTAPATKGYSVGIGTTRYEIFRPPAESFATLGFNHVSWDVLYSGDRDVYPITARDLELTAAAAADARSRGWLVDAPYVRPHRESPGSNTICPGNRAAYPDPPRFPFGSALAWVGIVTANHKEAPPMPPKVAPEFFPALDIVSVCSFTDHVGRVAFAMVDASGAVFCEPAASYMGGANGKSYFAGRTAARIDPVRHQRGYIITATSEETYGPDFDVAG